MAKDISIVLAGVGGQGTLIAGKLLGILAMKQGLDIKVSEVHGMSQRGGSVITYVRMGEKVYSPIIEEGMADYVLSFEEVEAVRWAKLLKKDPENIKDSLEASASGKAKVVEFDALSAALSCGSSKAVNMVMVGALSAGMDFPKELWIEAINEAFASKAKLIPMNVEAFNKGRDFVS